MTKFNKIFTPKEIERGSRKDWIRWVWYAIAIASLCWALQISWGIGNLRGLQDGRAQGIQIGINICESNK